MVSDSGSRYAMLVSVLAHAALLVATPVVSAKEMRDPPVAGAGTLQPVDSGGGDTFEIDGLVDAEPAKGKPVQGSEARDEGDADPPPAPEVEQERRVPVVAPAKPAVPPALPPTADADPDPSPSPAATEPPQQPAPAPSASANGEADQTPRAGSAGAADDGADGSGGSREGHGRRYGDASALRGVRNISADFARAIPAAVSADRIWSRLSLGQAGTVELEVVLDGDGKLVEHVMDERASKPMRLLVKRTLALLQAGRFALTSAPGLAGRERLRIEVTLSQRQPLEHAGDDPNQALNLGHEPPSASEPGKAYFTLASGRHFEARITILGSVPRAASDGPVAAGDE